MKKMIIIIILSVIAIPLIIIFIGKINLSIQFKKEVAELFSQSKNISYKTFSCEQMSGLPEPVQRYFKQVLKEGQPYISYVRLMHDGQFKPDQKKDWVDIEGEQYFTTEKPGFIWKGKTSLFTARDMYIFDKGRIIVSLLSLFKVVNGEGTKYDQIIKFERQKQCYDERLITVLEKGHITGALSYEKLRRHILTSPDRNSRTVIDEYFQAEK